jgi:hypothetical protein
MFKAIVDAFRAGMKNGEDTANRVIAQHTNIPTPATHDPKASAIIEGEATTVAIRDSTAALHNAQEQSSSSDGASP